MKFCFIWTLLIAGACHSVTETGPAEEQGSNEVGKVDTVFQLRDLVCDRAVKDFYRERNFAVFWSTNGRLHAVGDSLMVALRQSHFYGLSPNDYHVPELDHLLYDTTALDRLERIDLLLTDGYLALYNHLKQGRLDRRSWTLRDYSDVADPEALASLRDLEQVSLRRELENIQPGHPQYHALKNALRHALLKPHGDSAADERILSLSLNMERWRWEKQWPDRCVVVNIPSFLLRVVEADSIWLESRVVVGKRRTPTPVLESVIRSFLIYPYWHVPYSISTKEILPELQEDASYLKRNNFQVLNRKGHVIADDTIQWDLYHADHFPFTLRQREGSENSMGIIKFNFANGYGVYLHDTNSKRLYAQSRRDLSHGCVRVEKAVRLAHYLVREDDIYVSPDDLDQYLSLQQRLKIDLRKPIPLKLVYFTAEVREGVPFFYEDIYKKDSVMRSAWHPPVVVSRKASSL